MCVRRAQRVPAMDARRPLACDLEARHRARHPDVEGRQCTVLRNRRDGIAPLAYQRRQPLLLAAHHHRDRAVAQWKLIERLRGLTRQPDRPHTDLAQVFQRGGHPAYDSEGEVLDGAGRCLSHRG